MRLPVSDLQKHQRSVSERVVSPGNGVVQGVWGAFPNKQETAVPGVAGNRSFEHLWEQMHCLPRLYPFGITNMM